MVARTDVGPLPLAFTLPEIPVPRPARYHPEHQRIEAQARSWARGNFSAVLGGPVAVERFLGSRTAAWSMLIFPTVTAEAALDICKWIDWAFTVDDFCERSSVAAEPTVAAAGLELDACLAVLDGRSTGQVGGLASILSVLCRDTAARMSPRHWLLFRRLVAGFLESCAAEMVWQSHAGPVTVEQYLRVRRHAVSDFCLLQLEDGLGVDLARMRDRAALDRAGTAVLDHWIFVNDIFSFRKELVAGTDANLVFLLGATVQEAVDELAALAGQRTQEFCKAAADLRRGPDWGAAVEKYLDGLSLMMAGNLEWSLLTPRYNGPGHVRPDSDAGPVTLTPRRTRYGTTGGAS